MKTGAQCGGCVRYHPVTTLRGSCTDPMINLTRSRPFVMHDEVCSRFVDEALHAEQCRAALAAIGTEWTQASQVIGFVENILPDETHRRAYAVSLVAHLLKSGDMQRQGSGLRTLLRKAPA